MLPERLRTFLGVELPDDVRNRIWQAESVLKEQSPHAARWVPKENLHLTVKFMGLVGREAIPGILETLRRRLSECSQVAAAVGGVELFPPGHKPHVVSVSVHREPRLESIHQAVEKGLAHFKIKKEHRGYIPHITLGRLKRTAPGDLTAFDFTGLGDNMGTLPVTHLTLFMSELGPGGPVYTRLGRIEIGK